MKDKHDIYYPPPTIESFKSNPSGESLGWVYLDRDCKGKYYWRKAWGYSRFNNINRIVYYYRIFRNKVSCTISKFKNKYL